MTDIILHLSAGKGPEECRWVLAQLVKAFTTEGARQGVTCEVLEAEGVLPASLLLSVSGDVADAFARERIGTMLWVGTSHVRPLHKRRNWFVSVTSAPLVESVPELRDADI